MKSNARDWIENWLERLQGQIETLNEIRERKKDLGSVEFMKQIRHKVSSERSYFNLYVSQEK